MLRERAEALRANIGGAHYGTVAVFEDLYGNKFDLIQPRKNGRPTSCSQGLGSDSAVLGQFSSRHRTSPLGKPRVIKEEPCRKVNREWSGPSR